MRRSPVMKKKQTTDGINILDQPDQFKKLKFSIAARKRRISNNLSEEDSNSVSLARRP